MNFLEKIDQDLREAFLRKEKTKLSTLRLLKAAIENVKIELRVKKKKLDEEVVAGVLKREIKKRKEAIALYEQGKRLDLASKEKEEIKVLERYLPLELSDEEIKKIIQKKISELSPEVNFGKIIGEVMKLVAGKADGARVSALVKEEIIKINQR